MSSPFRSKSELRRISTQVLGSQDDKEDKDAVRIRKLLDQGEKILTGRGGEKVRKQLLAYAKKHRTNGYLCHAVGECFTDDCKKVYTENGPEAAAMAHVAYLFADADADEFTMDITVHVVGMDEDRRAYDIDVRPRVDVTWTVLATTETTEKKKRGIK